MTVLAKASTQPEVRSAIVRPNRSLQRLLVWMAVAVAAFFLAYLGPEFGWAIVFYLFALVQLTRAGTTRAAFYSGSAVGFLIAAGKLWFFWRIFSGGALALWSVYAVWVGLFVAAGRLVMVRWDSRWGIWLLPFLWCGLEYFRSELYYLRFSWLTPGLALDVTRSSGLAGLLGGYGIGFLLMAMACGFSQAWRKRSPMPLLGVVLVAAPLLGIAWLRQTVQPPSAVHTLRVAAVQLEFPSETELLVWLSELARRHPEADLLVLSEYTFTGPPPEALRRWCRDHAKYLIVGGGDPVSGGNFYDTAFVIGPSGEIVFRQAKCVPIQFFRDGLPAKEQGLWESPWGKLGICICYDLSYTRVTDHLARMGAEALIVPTMDVADWGRGEHELHARVGPVRAAEYHVPIFRLASSGISQAIDASGRILASAPYPGQAAMMSAALPLTGAGTVPIDRWLAPASVWVTLGVLFGAAAPKRFFKTQFRC